jgi:hypothetical protein
MHLTIRISSQPSQATLIPSHGPPLSKTVSRFNLSSSYKTET